MLGMAVLAGCASEGSKPVPRLAEAPVSQQAPVGDARTRAKAHTELGRLYYQGGRMAVAMEEARIAIDADAAYAPAYNLLGMVHMSLKETAPAEAAFRRALSHAPGDPEINNSYGWFLCQAGREKESFDYFLAASRNPLYEAPTRPYTNAGLCALRLGDNAAAEDYFRQAVRADPGNTQALFHVANLSYRRGEFEEARRYIDAVHGRIEPTAESLWLALRIERKLGNKPAETRYANQLRREFAGSKEQQALGLGLYE
jgi:type IV pilus assembly protein PilF